MAYHQYFFVSLFACFVAWGGDAAAQRTASYHTKPKEEAVKQEAVVEEQHASIWSYTGTTGPKHWGDLDPSYIMAKVGKHQSPIDLQRTGALSVDFPAIRYHYQEMPLKFFHDGHSLGAQSTSENYFEYHGSRYDLLRFHFHTPSEHTVGGKSFPMELHFVHKNDKGHLAVLGLFFVEGIHNKQIQSIIDHASNEVAEFIVQGVNIDINDLLPNGRSYWSYEGSLTTPPCSEGVQWRVFRDVVEASPEQIKALRALMGENARPVQDLNHRNLFVDRF